MYLWFSFFSLFLLFMTSLLMFTHKWFHMSALSASSPSLSLSECRWFNSRLRVVSFGCSMSPVPAQAWCLHTGVMDSVAADTAHISLSCPVPWGWTVIVRLHTAMATPYMAQKEWLITWLWGNALFSSEVCFVFHCTAWDMTARVWVLLLWYCSRFSQMVVCFNFFSGAG